MLRREGVMCRKFGHIHNDLYVQWQNEEQQPFGVTLREQNSQNKEEKLDGHWCKKVEWPSIYALTSTYYWHL